MTILSSSPRRTRISFDADPSFKPKVRVLAKRWGVKTNVAIQRAVDVANARKWSDEEKNLLKTVAARVEEIAALLLLP